ncbi:isocitrate lyase/PEP mutase family protein [Lapillicoccus jejuensis]|uniref:2-methylisocitrate lyase-like PEP mutase family enzyme n=1 Tax=Lapillicoccus jejuensis TaxID=402171 RepID=A0A542DXP8_9MICO|nr:isocitrate lyase/phosphoenolpyruvate mutase family protein [Lapillicoccus jejuensis]TQJ07861.1 2-methylisocitrate lyase-like PEP mutase family enzyme [Lapillicoccus jejuensis]
MTTAPDDFLALHVPGRPLLLPNPWDLGSARLLVGLGARALGTTSAGLAGAGGRPDGQVGRDEALAHAAAVAAAVPVPVSADLENGYADDPDGVAATVALAAQAGLAGCSVEDWDPVREQPYPLEHAVERVAAAAATARRTGVVLTARADAGFHGSTDLDDAVRRLVAFAEAGAPVVYAPGHQSASAVRTLAGAVAPTGARLNVIALPGTPAVAELAASGVARVSTGSGLYWAAMGGLVGAARELLEQGTYGFWQEAATGRAEGGRAFADS